ncbi:MAG: hypothetical protein ACI9KE_001348 [Polyangiales bacterium]
MRLLAFLTLVPLFVSCGDDDRVRRDTGIDTTDAEGLDANGRDAPFPDIPDNREDSCQKMDILFIIDDSGSMSEEQSNLISNFPLFVEVLDNYRTDAGNPLDYRLGVTTTGRDITTVVTFNVPAFPFPPMEIRETGPNGALLQPSECSMPRRWIESADPDVASTFSCVANVGTGGSSVEMPLLMTERALTDRVDDGTNAGFLREDALLAVIMLTDENDCSRPEDRVETTVDFSGGASGAADACDPDGDTIIPTMNFINSLDAVKGERGRWAAAIIAGPGPGSCSSSFGDAAEATRLSEFVSQAGENVVFSSICDADIAGSLMTALDTFDVACQNFPPLI